MYYLKINGFEDEKFETEAEVGEWLIDHIYDIPHGTRFQIFNDLGCEYGEEEIDSELEKGDYEYECRD